MLTVVTAPVDVDAAAVGTGELGQREAGWVCWEEGREEKQIIRMFVIPTNQAKSTV